MMSFEQVIDIFGDYLALDTEMEVCKSRYGYIRVEFHGTGELPGYCSGMVCRKRLGAFLFAMWYCERSHIK